MSDPLFRLVAREKQPVREELAHHRQQIADWEERLTHLEITERTLHRLDASDSAECRPDLEPGDATDDTEDNATSDRDAARNQDSAKPATEPDPLDASRLGPMSRKVATLVCSADRPLRTRDVSIALKRDVNKTQIEATRRALEGLVKAGYLVKLAAGLYWPVGRRLSATR